MFLRIAQNYHGIYVVFKGILTSVEGLTKDNLAAETKISRFLVSSMGGVPL